MEYYKYIIDRGGGMITCGEHLGVMIAPPSSVKGCPPGWVFIDISEATVELVQEAVALARRGRAAWPEPDV